MNCRARREVEFTDAISREITRVDNLWQSLRKKYQSAGAWLCGEFSIADCMYAPMASRFNTYQPSLSVTSAAYVDKVLEHPAVKEWFTQSAAEEEVIQQSEVGK